MQEETVYIKIPKEIKVDRVTVRLADLASLYCGDKELQKQLGDLKVLSLDPKRKQEKYMVSFMRIIALIKEAYPALEVENIGETDFVVSYNQKENLPASACHVLEWAKTALVCLILFFGAAFSIMAFNTDVSVEELFSGLYKLVTGTEDAKKGVLELSYCIGLPIGIIVFFDHFKPAVRRQDPTPMEVQMRTYEEDVNNALIQNAAREGRTIDEK